MNVHCLRMKLKKPESNLLVDMTVQEYQWKEFRCSLEGSVER